MERDFVLLHLRDKLLQVLASPWRVPAKQGICDYAHRPDVYRFRVTTLEHDLRRSVSERPSHASQHLLFVIQCFSNAKVCEYERRVGMWGDVEKIFRFEIYGRISIIWVGDEMKFNRPR